MVSFGNPIEIMSTSDLNATDLDNRVLHFFNILQQSDSLYYLYYAAHGQTNPSGEYKQNILFAYSKDGVSYTRGFPQGVKPPFPGTNRIFDDSDYPNVTGQFIFKVDDIEFPYRLIAQQNENDTVHYVNMYKSTDGIYFPKNTKMILLNSYHDTQHSAIVRDKKIKLYTRTREYNVINGVSSQNRKICIYYFDKEGNMITPMKILSSDYVYNSAAVPIDENVEFLSPTKFDNTEKPMPLDLSLYEKYSGWLTYDKWLISNNINSQHIVIPITDSKSFQIVAKPDSHVFYGFLSTYSPPISADSIPYVKGTCREEVFAGTEKIVSVPNDAKFLVLNATYDGLIYHYPKSISKMVASQEFQIINLLVDGYKEYPLSTNFNDVLNDDDKWVIVSPSLFQINGQMYMSYYTHDFCHDELPKSNSISKYYIIPITILKDTYI